MTQMTQMTQMPGTGLLDLRRFGGHHEMLATIAVFSSHATARQAIFEWRHSSLGYQSPVAYEETLNAP